MKLVVNLWIVQLKKFWIFKIVFSIINVLIWPISKILLLISYYKYLRGILLFLALLFGLKMDFDHFDFSYVALTGFLWTIWISTLDLILSWLQNLISWIIKYRMNQDNLASINDPIIDLPVLEDIKIDSNVEFNSPKHHEMLIERDKYQSQLLENIFSKEDVKSNDTMFTPRNIALGVAGFVSL